MKNADCHITAMCYFGIFLISCVSTHYCSELVLEAPFQVLPALDNSIGCAILSVAGAGLQYWMRRFKCFLIANSAGANSNLSILIACVAYSVKSQLPKLDN
jgi:hypothetical protein